MSNFTCPGGNTDGCVAPRILSFMITFGIQGIMLIAAWLIGETFAANNASQRSYRSGWFTGGMVIASAIIAIGLVGFVLQPDQFGNYAQYATFDPNTLALLKPGLGLIALVGGAVVLFLILSRREIAGPYLSGAMVVLRNIPLWIMFLSCMATSVFFSFDSLFSEIFPQKDRERAASLRVENRVQGVLQDVQKQLETARLRETRALFTSPSWNAFSTGLTKLVETAEGAPQAVKDRKLQQLAEQTTQRAEIEARSRAADARQTTLDTERTRLRSQLEELDTRRAPAQEQIRALDDELAKKRTEIVTAQTAAEGELRGVRGTGNAGAGPEFRRLRREVQNLELDATEIERRLAAARKRVVAINEEAATKRARLAEIGRALIDVERTRTEAQQSLSIFEQSGRNTLSGDLDAAGGIRALEEARKKFRREPTEAGLERVQQLCTSLDATMREVKVIGASGEVVNCDTGDAAVRANGIFRIRDAEQRFRAACTQGEKLPRGDATATLNFGSVCIQNSGLAGEETESFRSELNRIGLNRDDQAHRFVVSWNAFNDGNALAYLALGIALAIDGLVFMSGLFGANVVRSPLSFLREEEIERKIDNALGDSKLAAIGAVIRSIRSYDGPIVGSFLHQISRRAVEEDEDVMRMVAAGQDMGVVRYEETPRERADGVVETDRRFALHADFNQQLQAAYARHQSRYVEANSHDPKRSPEEIRKITRPQLINALRPHVFDNAQDFLKQIEPDSARVGFMGVVSRPEPPSPFAFWSKTARDVDHRRRVLAVGTAEKLVESNARRDLYYIRPLLFSMVNEIFAEAAEGKYPEPAPRSEASPASVATTTPAHAAAPRATAGAAAPRQANSSYENTSQSRPAPASEQSVASAAAVAPNVASSAATPRQADQYAAPDYAAERDRARVPIEQQAAESSDLERARTAFFSALAYDEPARRSTLRDVNTASTILNRFRDLGAGAPARLVDAVETWWGANQQNLRAAIDEPLRDKPLVQQELEKLAISAAARETAGKWKMLATRLTKKIEAAGNVTTQDGTRAASAPLAASDTLDTILADLEELHHHDRFDERLVELFKSAQLAERILPRMDGEQSQAAE
ncbi:MAG: hypothetical protein AAFQ42_07270 [Pseudomonadota bacterium]